MKIKYKPSLARLRAREPWFTDERWDRMLVMFPILSVVGVILEKCSVPIEQILLTIPIMALLVVILENLRDARISVKTAK